MYKGGMLIYNLNVFFKAFAIPILVYYFFKFFPFILFIIVFLLISNNAGLFSGTKKSDQYIDIDDVKEKKFGFNSDIFNFLGSDIQNRLSSILSSKNIFRAFCAVFVIWISSGFFMVKMNEKAVVMRFGKVINEVGPGLHWKFPKPIEETLKRDVTILHKINTSSDLKDNLMITKDENLLLVDMVIFWRISNLKNYLFKAKRPDEIINAAASSIIRYVISLYNTEQCLTLDRDEIGNKVTDLLNRAIISYDIGIDIVDVQMGKIDPPSSVISSYRDVLKAKLEKETKINEAQSYANFVIPSAKGEAEKIINNAKSYYVEKIEKAKGLSGAFLKKYEEIKNNRDLSLFFMNLECISDVLHDKTVYVVPGSAMNNNFISVGMDSSKLDSLKLLNTEKFSEYDKSRKLMHKKLITKNADNKSTKKVLSSKSNSVDFGSHGFVSQNYNGGVS
ncbi:FtsH protease activity modulator HflK [Candidatus Nesciobacter abundans]|uniref:Protein HflK n=1 Tax=Candidatus Nesciobacter abundans TaxID=2601668 RepID=A0A5C0UGS0_9PROT|nr:FtsH protease activity modulator HflK [Candidatus Nesciobacter abundans]QEK39278.1 FtsH protease activity modulator HflK [Candidatus Nesciobacter abundans]